MYANNHAFSIDRDPVHVYKTYKEKRPPSMLEPVCKLKTETHSSVEGKNWCKAQPMGVNKLNKIMKDMTQAAGIQARQTTVVEKL